MLRKIATNNFKTLLYNKVNNIYLLLFNLSIVG